MTRLFVTRDLFFMGFRVIAVLTRVQAEERAAKETGGAGRVDAAVGGALKEKVAKLESELQVCVVDCFYLLCCARAVPQRCKTLCFKESRLKLKQKTDEAMQMEEEVSPHPSHQLPPPPNAGSHNPLTDSLNL